MTMHCALCNRTMQSALVYIGVYPVGPTCARKAGLTNLAARGSSRLLKLAAPATRSRDDAQMVLELEVAHG